MRLIAFVLTMVCLGAAAFAGQALWKASQIALPALTSTEPERTDKPEQVRKVAFRPSDWPSLFGDVVAPEPQPPAPVKVVEVPKSEPQPPAPPTPPIGSLGYALQGIASDGKTRWAILSHPTGDYLLRVGDPLGEHHTVVSIDESGLLAKASDEAQPEKLGFAE